jgi:hypothetical protein
MSQGVSPPGGHEVLNQDVEFLTLLIAERLQQPIGDRSGSIPKIHERPGVLTAGGRLDSADRIGEHLKANLENLRTWAGLGIDADSPTNRQVAWLRRQCCRAVISDVFNWIYRFLAAAGAIEDLAAATAYHFTEWLPRIIVAAP